MSEQHSAKKSTVLKRRPSNKRPVKRRTIATKSNPQLFTFAKISLLFKTKTEYSLDENEFKFLLATAIKTVHGDIANEPDVLGFKVVNSQNYEAFIRFKTIHHARTITSLILFGEYKNLECKFEIHGAASTPCFLSI